MNKTIKTGAEIKEWMDDKLHTENEKFKDFTFNTPINRERLNENHPNWGLPPIQFHHSTSMNKSNKTYEALLIASEKIYNEASNLFNMEKQ